MPTGSLSSKSFRVPVKAHEIIFVWLLVGLVSHYALRLLLVGVQNSIYIQCIVVTLTMIFLCKHFLRWESLSFVNFIGNAVKKTELPEIAMVLGLALTMGIASWSVLVLSSANIDAGWSYQHWNLNTSENFRKTEWRPSWILLESIAAVVLAPITEELVFRGFVLRRLREKYSANAAIVVSSLIFGAIHIHQSFLSAFFVGILCGTLAVRMSSLYAPMLVHGAYNGLIFLLELNFGLCSVVDATQIASVSYWLPELFMFCAGSVAVLIYVWRAIAASDSPARRVASPEIEKKPCTSVGPGFFRPFKRSAAGTND